MIEFMLKYGHIKRGYVLMTEKRYKEWVQTEYIKKKQSTVDALRQMSVDDLYDHIKAYKDFMLSLAMDHEQEIMDGNLEKQIEKQLRQVDTLEKFLKDGITESLVHIMLDEEIIMHLIKKVKKDQTIGACCETSFD